MTVSKLRPPTDDRDKWERGLDPWHEDAFPDQFKPQALRRGTRQQGWFELDGAGNRIAFYPDGVEI